MSLSLNRMSGKRCMTPRSRRKSRSPGGGLQSLRGYELSAPSGRGFRSLRRACGAAVSVCCGFTVDVVSRQLLLVDALYFYGTNSADVFWT